MEQDAGVWVTRSEVGNRIKVAPKTLAQWATQGKGPRFAKLGGAVRYRLDDVIAWENQQFNDAA